METKDVYRDLIVGSSIIVILAVTLIIGIQFLANKSFEVPEYQQLRDAVLPKKLEGTKAFASAEEFKQYLEQASQDEMFFGGSMGMSEPIMMENRALDARSDTAFKASGSASMNRVSQTNVQVGGIDEPDMVKTDGKEIYVSDPNRIGKRTPIPFEEPGLVGTSTPYNEKLIIDPQGGIHAVKAFPPADMKIDSTIEQGGDLLLSEDTLIVIGAKSIHGYNVSNPTSPQEKWLIDIEKKNQIISSRLYDNSLYLVTKTAISQNQPCPIRPMKIQDELVEIPCDSIYHPVTPVPVDATFTAMKIDIEKGKIAQHASFVGRSGSSIVYMSPTALYISYTYPVSMTDVMLPFIEKNADIFSSEIVEKARKLSQYDISERSKIQEMELLMKNALESLSDDEQLKLGNEMENRMQQYLEEVKRELEKTGIAKIQLDDLQFENTGIVPGYLLNQFSMDEYEGNLRVATTLGSTWNQFSGRQQSANDVYILDTNMSIMGSVQDMGIDERIYSVRFLEDKGYVVTFRQIDPFIVLDLSNPKKPEKKGELKIPGYSSYLHPLGENSILGIGKEDANVKISLFDVSDADNPIERSKYLLDEYWSDILNTHHAFLVDEKHSVFFLPGNKGGYIFSYENNQIELEKAVSDIQAKRALYINDYLYIIGQDKIVVLNESDWERVNELSFN